MDFDLNDPLAGILSDGSDDSFFDDDILGKKKNTKKKLTPVADRKNALFELDETETKKTTSNLTLNDKKNSLFDLEPSTKTITPLNQEGGKLTSIINDVSKGQSPTPVKRTISKESIQPNKTEILPKGTIKKMTEEMGVDISPAKVKTNTGGSKLDLLDDINMAPKKQSTKTLERGKSSQSIFDDILGGPSTKVGIPDQHTARPNTTPKSQEFYFDDLLGKSESKPTLNKIVQRKENLIQKKEETHQKKTKSSGDWLGVFQEQITEAENDDDGMPSWLLGNTKKKKTTEKDIVNQKEPKSQAEAKLKEVNEIPLIEDELHKDNSNIDTYFKPESNLILGSNEDITAEGAALYLQQQESHLMVALQLKAQEEKLAALQIRQEESQRVKKEVARAHHAQLDSMLQRHAAHRQQMQAVITTHQDRINERIKAILGSTLNIEGNDDVEAVEDHDTSKDNNPHSKERKQLLQLVQSLQENHDKEIDLMETSYRRQLAFIEVSLSQSEERMKEESDKLVKFYTEKIGWLEEHHLSYKQLAEENVKSLMERHNNETVGMREQHLENIRMMQEHHSALMENIKNAVRHEHNLIRESAGFSTNLLEMLADVKENKMNCQSLVRTVQELVDNTQRDTEKHVQVKDAQINDMIQQLKRERENFDIEKGETREMIKLLESRLKQMTQLSEEELAALKQRRMEFEFEKATFNKQTEFAKNVLKKQDEDIKMLKEEIQKDYQEKITRLEDEKSKAQRDSIGIAKEKASVQNLKQELEKMKVELQIQLEEVSEERSRINIEKQRIHMEGQRNIAKSRDLELLAKAAVEKQSQADQKYSEAEHIQRKYEERIRRIQEHVVSLNSREKHIAREKVALSRERINLHNDRKQIENQQQCSLCKSMQTFPEYENITKYTLPESFLSVPIGISRDYNATGVSTAMNDIEHGMAHLLGRNLGLKSAVIDSGVNPEPNVEREISEHVESSAGFKTYMDPKLSLLRLDVQRVISNIDCNKSDATDDESK